MSVCDSLFDSDEERQQLLFPNWILRALLSVTGVTFPSFNPVHSSPSSIPSLSLSLLDCLPLVLLVGVDSKGILGHEEDVTSISVVRLFHLLLFLRWDPEQISFPAVRNAWKDQQRKQQQQLKESRQNFSRLTSSSSFLDRFNSNWRQERESDWMHWERVGLSWGCLSSSRLLFSYHETMQKDRRAVRVTRYV